MEFKNLNSKKINLHLLLNGDLGVCVHSTLITIILVCLRFSFLVLFTLFKRIYDVDFATANQAEVLEYIMELCEQKLDAIGRQERRELRDQGAKLAMRPAKRPRSSGGGN